MGTEGSTNHTEADSAIAHKGERIMDPLVHEGPEGLFVSHEARGPDTFDPGDAYVTSLGELLQLGTRNRGRRKRSVEVIGPDVVRGWYRYGDAIEMGSDQSIEREIVDGCVIMDVEDRAITTPGHGGGKACTGTAWPTGDGIDRRDVDQIDAERGTGTSERLGEATGGTSRPERQHNYRRESLARTGLAVRTRLSR
ncbi:MAG: hypothetical protein GY708_02015 [Actinomycetia bacterium]|nr:hypothetical protein [Actinomycetes bacterium]